MEIAILKTGALGDVLRTTSILPGLRRRYADARIVWITAHDALDLIRLHPLLEETRAVDPADVPALEALAREWAGRFARVLSFDDEEPLCALATRLAGHGAELSGAFRDEHGAVRYTPDVAPWFDMGLLSTHGKAEADRRKLANRESHPQIFARMLGLEPGEPELVLPPAALAFAEAFARERGLHGNGPAIGLNTGAGGRWESKRLPVARVVELVHELERRCAGRVSFLLLGGPAEARRNAEIRAALAGVRLIDAGTEHDLASFAALVDRLDLLVTSDSLALHVAVARRVPLVAFFAPTSAAEIELYGRGEKVESSAPDYCSYRSDADTSTLTAGRLADAALRVLARATRQPDRATPRRAL